MSECAGADAARATPPTADSSSAALMERLSFENMESPWLPEGSGEGFACRCPRDVDSPRRIESWLSVRVRRRGRLHHLQVVRLRRQVVDGPSGFRAGDRDDLARHHDL